MIGLGVSSWTTFSKTWKQLQKSIGGGGGVGVDLSFKNFTYNMLKCFYYFISSNCGKNIPLLQPQYLHISKFSNLSCKYHIKCIISENPCKSCCATCNTITRCQLTALLAKLSNRIRLSNTDSGKMKSWKSYTLFHLSWHDMLAVALSHTRLLLEVQQRIFFHII